MRYWVEGYLDQEKNYVYHEQSAFLLDPNEKTAKAVRAKREEFRLYYIERYLLQQYTLRGDYVE